MTGAALTGWALALAGAGTAVALTAVDRSRRELVARACHELAGPLGAAGLALHAARREAPAPRLAAVDLELQRAARALEDLDAARAGRRARDRAGVVDVGCLLAQQALAWQASARAGGRELRVAVASGLLVRGDAVRLAQAVGNLLANAIEHGRGRIELRAVLGARDGAVRIEVADEGAGPAEPLAMLVARPRAGRGRRGRGLAIAAEVAARHGGRLSAEGARLAIELPRLRRTVGR